MTRSKLRGTLYCNCPVCFSGSPASPGDLVVARMRTPSWDECYVVGVVKDAGEDGAVLAIATAKEHPRLKYNAQCHIGAKAVLAQRTAKTAEQIALALPSAFKDWASVVAAVRAEIGSVSAPHCEEGKI